MISLNDAVTARLESHGERFEVLIDPYAHEKLEEDPSINVVDLLAAEEVFSDASKGDRASTESLEKIFGTDEVDSIVRQILDRGDIQLTTEQRKKMQEDKRKQIVATIVRNAINPQTRTPHPPQRIENAMEEARVHIDPFKPVNVQVQDVLDELRPLIPISFEKTVIAVKASPEDYGRIYGDVKSFGRITKEEWQPDGSWIGLVEIPAGVQSELYDRLNSKTHGAVETRKIK